MNQSINRSINHALWVYRLQPPEPASKDAVFKPGASTWNTDDPKQQHHAPGMQLWLAPWHATLACNMACNSGLHHGMQLWLAAWHATLACSMACNSGLQHGMQLWLAAWHAAGEIHADVHAILACNMRAASDIHACIYKAARLREAWAQL